MPPITDQIDATEETLIQLCLPDKTIGAIKTSVGIGKNIDSIKLNNLRYNKAFMEPHFSMIDVK